MLAKFPIKKNNKIKGFACLLQYLYNSVLCTYLMYSLVTVTISGIPAPGSHVAPLKKVSVNLLFISSNHPRDSVSQPWQFTCFRCYEMKRKVVTSPSGLSCCHLLQWHSGVQWLSLAHLCVTLIER